MLGLHKGLSHFLSWQRTRFGVGPEDRSAQLTALSFDVVLRDVFLPLTSGAILCLPDEHDLSTPDRTVLWLERERITTLHAVPALAETWLAEAPPGIFLRHLRLVFFAGEPLRDSLVRRWRQSFPESGEMVNLYGPTETTLAKCFHVVPADESPGIQPVGRPLPQTQALVLNGSRALCGAGELGEIVIRTPFRTLGYLNDPASNEARFAINPFTGDPNDRLYFTGDRGRYRADGSVAILGRLDNQVKIRGVRVELEEIEALLSHSPLIASCVVTAELDGNGNLSLVAYVVPSGHVDNELAVDLRRFATTFFPAAMVPSAFVFVDRVPLTPNGKADRVALASQRGPIGSADLETAAPRTPVEEVLASIWQDLLARTRLSIYDNFFELGGHSLLATQVASRINKAFGISIPLRAFFEHPTIAGLAAEVEAFAQAPEKLPIPPIERAADRSVFPLSFAQRRLWILHRLHPESTAYNIPFVVRIRGPLDTAAFDAALASLVRRHEILRTIFPIEDGSPIQVVLGTPDTVLAIIDLRKVPAEEREAELEYVTLTEARRPFSLTREPGLRASLVQLSPGDHLLLMTMHHIINDGWSRTTLADEVMLSYGAMRSGAAPLPQPPIQYGDFAAWQRGMLEYELIELLGYWGRELEGAPSELVLPFDRARSAEAEHTGAIASIVIGPDLSDLVVKLSRRTGTSLFMTMLAALKILLYKWTGQSDIVLGTVIANRNRLDTERLLGCFVNFLPLRSRLSEPDTGFNLLDRIRTTVLEAYKHQDCPFDLIVDEVKPERKQNANPIYNVVFQLQNLPQARLAEMHNLELQHKPIELGTSLLDLRFVARETAEGIHLLCEYDTGVFVQDTIDSLLSCYTETLRKIAMEPGARLREHPLSERLEEQVTRSG
ncbi:MAG TPA: condensation domain-containing protein, partial [Blastocatellia bacterium]|nr:condensation domain-containing protein [Blastocatellia bacterium]